MNNLFLYIIILFALISCSPLKPNAKLSIPLSPEAKKTYNFLYFLDLEQQKKIEEAKKEAIKLLQLDPSPYIYLEVSNFYWRNLDFVQARKILKEGIKKFSTNKDLYLSLAKSYLAEKRLNDAEITLEEYLKQNPKDFSIYSDLAAIYLENKKYTKVVDLLEKLPSSKQSKITYYYLGRANFELGLIQKAESFLKKSLQLDPNFFEAWTELAYIYEVGKKYAEAEEIYSKLLEQGEENQELILRIIELNLKLNNPEKAKTFLNSKITSNNLKLRAFLEFFDNKYYEEAKEILEEIIKTEGYSDKIYFYLALLSFEKDKNYSKSIYYLDQITKESQFYFKSLQFKVQIFLLEKKYNQAKNILEQLRKQHSESKEFYLLQIYFLEQQGLYPQALKWVDSALKKWSKDKEILYRKGVILENLKQRKEALKVMEYIISLYPEYDPALNFVGYSLAEEGKDLSRAKVLVETALKADPENGYYLDSLAWVYFKMGDFKKAWQYIQEAITHTQDDPTIWEHYGDIALTLKKIKEALKGYKNSLQLKPNNPRLKKLVQQLREK